MVCNFSESCWMLAVGKQPNHYTLLNISSTAIFHKMPNLTSIHSKSMKHTDWTLLHNQHVAVVAHILWTPLKTLDWAVHHHCHNFLLGASLIEADHIWPIFIIGFMRMKLANLSKCFFVMDTPGPLCTPKIGYLLHPSFMRRRVSAWYCSF